jgi:hypothetical protein
MRRRNFILLVFAGKFYQTSLFSGKISITWNFTILADHPRKISVYAWKISFNAGKFSKSSLFAVISSIIFPYFHGNIFSMVLLHEISGKIPLHFMKTFFHALKETSKLFIGNFATSANISKSICNSVNITLLH